MAEIQINKSCHELYWGGRYNYSISIPDSLQIQDCDRSWKGADGTDLDHGSFVLRDFCETGIRHIVRCFNPSNLTEYIFNVFNSTFLPLEAANVNRSHFIIMLAIFIFLFIGIGVLCAKSRSMDHAPVNINGYMNGC